MPLLRREARCQELNSGVDVLLRDQDYVTRLSHHPHYSSSLPLKTIFKTHIDIVWVGVHPIIWSKAFARMHDDSL